MQAHVLRNHSGKILAAGVAAPGMHVKFATRSSPSAIQATSIEVSISDYRQCHAYFHELVAKSEKGTANSSASSRKDSGAGKGGKKRAR